LPLSDTRDFEEEKKGFIAAPDSWKIMPGTRGPETPEDLNDFEVGHIEIHGE
jgi:alkyl sulfatase BDS1-like metallo-beta-lactamase superfamily hydrolase